MSDLSLEVGHVKASFLSGQEENRRMGQVSKWAFQGGTACEGDPQSEVRFDWVELIV